MILVSHPTGNAFVRALLQGLESIDELDSFHTTITSLREKGLPRWIDMGSSRRSFPVPDSKIQLAPAKEFVRLLAPKVGLSWLTLHESGWASIDAVCRDLDERVAQRIARRHQANQSLPYAVYSYEDCCSSTFEQAKRLGIKCFYELPIAYFETTQRLLAEENERLPDWRVTLTGIEDSAEKLQRKRLEISASDVVVCPSEFVLNTLPADIRQRKTCIVSEFGTPQSSECVATPREARTDNSRPQARTDNSRFLAPSDNSRSRPRSDNAPLRILFAGSMSQRKGLADLFQAMKLIHRKDVELVVMGSPIAPMSFYRSQLEEFTYESPRPHAEVLQLMRSCDVFVLPSIVEGRALVQQEAMSCGLPLLVTENAGGGDLVELAKTGFLVPIRSPESLAAKIEWFADNRQATYEMGQLAILKAKELTWERYVARILETILPEDSGSRSSFAQHKAI